MTTSVLIGNFMDTMNQACVSRPYAANGDLIVPNRALFETSTPSSTSRTATSASSSFISGSTSTGAPTTATPTSTNESGIIQSATTTATPTPTAASNATLSTGAVAGIAVGATILGLGLIAGLVIFLRRKRKSQVQAGGHMIQSPPDSSVGLTTVQLKDGQFIHEKPAGGMEGQVHEAPYHSESRFVELPATSK
ncbi:hypothetical protein H2198_001595 [Neophaeococcomyces mojaviensis]|uniref:Uncharacterized protein n=1 Tax=Neophaeococcomyces mojaviensis TaxID=3383035 RepID=A0ACC3AGR3_9EURO|nr:hypothetical protein H2198_001595 [Knufia sp. JES_112]